MRREGGVGVRGLARGGDAMRSACAASWQQRAAAYLIGLRQRRCGKLQCRQVQPEPLQCADSACLRRPWRQRAARGARARSARRRASAGSARALTPP